MSTVAPPRVVEVIATDAHEGPVVTAATAIWAVLLGGQDSR